MIVYNETKRNMVVRRLKVAKNVWERFRGLLGSKELEEGEGFLIPSCKGIHTFGMGYPIDVLYLDEESRIINVLDSFKPNLAGPVNWKANSVLELPKKTVERLHAQVGDVLVIEVEPSDSLPEPIPVKRSILDGLGNVFFHNDFRFV